MGIAQIELAGLIRSQIHTMEPWNVRFGIRMRTVRLLRSMKQEVACADLGITQGTLSRIESGKSIPSYFLMFRFARLYQWPVMGFDPDQPLGDFTSLLPFGPGVPGLGNIVSSLR